MYIAKFIPYEQISANELLNKTAESDLNVCDGRVNALRNSIRVRTVSVT